MMKKKKAVRKLSAFFLACTCLITSVYTPYLGSGRSSVYAQDIQAEDAEENNQAMENGSSDENAQNLPGGYKNRRKYT